jgi:hypothetical protein
MAATQHSIQDSFCKVRCCVGALFSYPNVSIVDTSCVHRSPCCRSAGHKHRDLWCYSCSAYFYKLAGGVEDNFASGIVRSLMLRYLLRLFAFVWIDKPEANASRRKLFS